MALPVIDGLPVLAKPYELLDLGDGGTKAFQVDRHELGQMQITPRVGLAKAIHVLRVWVPVADKALHPPYWDITATTLIDQLLPYLKSAAHARSRYTITKTGVAPTARFTLVVTPA
jgi:hypothetical protein